MFGNKQMFLLVIENYSLCNHADPGRNSPVISYTRNFRWIWYYLHHNSGSGCVSLHCRLTIITASHAIQCFTYDVCLIQEHEIPADKRHVMLAYSMSIWARGRSGLVFLCYNIYAHLITLFFPCCRSWKCCSRLGATWTK